MKLLESSENTFRLRLQTSLRVHSPKELVSPSEVEDYLKLRKGIFQSDLLLKRIMYKKSIHHIILFVFVYAIHVTCFAQTIPITRLLFHEKIDKAQKAVLAIIKADVPNQSSITNVLTIQIDNIQQKIEADSSINNNQKIKYLRGTEDILIFLTEKLKANTIGFSNIPNLIQYYIQALSLEQQSKTIAPVVEQIPSVIGDIIIRSASFQKNIGLKDAEDIVIRKFCEENPALALSTLRNHPNNAFIDKLIQIRAYQDPEELYRYAAATNTELGKKIQLNNDSLVHTIAKLSLNNRGRLYFPFLDKLMNGLLKMDDITKVIDSDDDYYKLLVQTQIEYTYRIVHKDTPIAYASLIKALQEKAINIYITQINELHEQPDNIRFKRIDVLTPQEIYYLLVLGEDEIYTSSYLGAYKIMFQKMKNARSDSLLMGLTFDHFRKCIKMAAGYNTLDDFLKRMEKDNANRLMIAFVNGLDKTNSLEDAVDVANSYASITNHETSSLIHKQITYNLIQAGNTGNKKAQVIYDLLNRLFTSYDSIGKKDISAKLGIPSVYELSNQSLKDDKGRIIMQLFFYGDKDGIGIFNNFLSSFNNANWKITQDNEWVSITSTKGTPMVIFANKPLSNEESLDAQAQANLITYMNSNGFKPTIVVHRGHSYYLPYTINQLSPTAKIILLGSCGAYHNLNDVLKICPDAHIISSKQIGSGTVNQPMLNLLIETVRSGKNIEWIPLWNELSKQLGGYAKEKFDDYIPPYKNLGAIFIKAYRKAVDN